MFCAASAAWRVIRRIAPAYGRSASMRCSARRRRAAATISIARVIFWMFLTDAMRFLTSFWAMAYAVARRGLLLALLGLALVAVAVLVAAASRRRPLRSTSISSDSGWPSSSRS